MKVPELKGGQMLTLAYIIAILVILFIVYKVIGKLGLVDTKEDKKKDEAAAALRTSNYFDPLYLKGNTSYKALGKTKATFYAGELRSSIKGWGTDEEKIYSVFGKLNSKENISEIALYYEHDFNRSLQSDLLNELNDKEMLILNNIINKLPNK